MNEAGNLQGTLVESEREPPVVLKFGGTSVRNADAMLRVAEIVQAERGRRPVVVVSACAGVTDMLLTCARLCGEGELVEAIATARAIRQRHLEILDALQPAPLWSCEPQLREMLDEIEMLVHGVALLQELTPRTVDAFASFGERLSSMLVATAFRGLGWTAALADSRAFIKTDATFGNARPLTEAIDALAPAAIMPLFDEHEVVIAQGFIGSTVDGIGTTIGRGGSDHSGALLGAALAAREIQIWTDVSGILTADPRVVPEAQVVKEVTFTEARELAFFGAKVLHPDTILPAVARNVPVVIRNSMRPADEGTRILSDQSRISSGIHSVTLKKGILLFELASRRGANDETILASSLVHFRHHGVPVLCALGAESRALVAVDEASCDDLLITELESCYAVRMTRQMTILALIGASLRRAPAVLSAPLAALADFPLAFVFAGSSDHLALVGVPEQQAGRALAAVHRALFE